MVAIAAPGTVASALATIIVVAHAFLFLGKDALRHGLLIRRIK